MGCFLLEALLTILICSPQWFEERGSERVEAVKRPLQCVLQTLALTPVRLDAMRILALVNRRVLTASRRSR
jgi:poly-D-alanine transfer protein DltD